MGVPLSARWRVLSQAGGAGVLRTQNARKGRRMSQVPDQPPDAAFWVHPFLALPQFEPMRLRDNGRDGVPNIGMDTVLQFLLGDVL